MIGRVGGDPFGAQLKESLAAAAVDVQEVRVTDATPTGVALILVDASGQNQIVVVPGANAALSPSDIEEAFAGADGGYLLLQLEIPLESVITAATAAQRRGMTVILDPAPARTLPRELLACIDVLTPNENEALTLLGRREATVALAQAPDVAHRLRDLGPATVIVKLGANGAFLSSASMAGHFAAPRVEVVDVTAAGDTFNGALAVALAEGQNMAGAIAFANAAAALSVTRAGAQASIPARRDVDAFKSRAGSS